jgi:hypothetical protein
MIEIIVLIFLAIHIGKIAARKGLKPGTWRLYCVLCWLAGEFAGAIAGAMIFGQDLISMMLMGLGGAIGGYLILKNNLDKKPDSIDDDINKIGSNDLRP